MFSLFYTHPYLLNEDGWKLLNLQDEKLLVDTDSLHVFGDCQVRMQYDDNDHITHVNLRSDLTGDELTKLFDKMLEYSKQVRADMNSHYDSAKVCDLASGLKMLNVNDESQEGASPE